MHRFIALTLVALFVTAPAASAGPSRVFGPATAANASAPGIRTSIATARFPADRASQPAAAPAPHKNSIATKASAAFVIGMLGAVGGALVGASIGGAVGSSREYGGTYGAVIGVPVGTTLGAIAGWQLAR